ncbi:MAG: 50S ribosomal protein L9 [Ardenticatenaceae bacterium]|nr:50S ribosomal protein L9 [Ardenticatenaceae bacterium]
MKVLLKQDIENIGLAGEVHKVADGYGRNFLLPQGLAVVASPGMMKQAVVWRKKAEARRAELRAEYEALSQKIEEVTLNFTARAGETGKLYGSITTTQIADDLNELLGTEIDRRKVGVEPLRQLGEHKVVVRLSGDFQPELTVVIANEDGETEPAIVEMAYEEVVVEETDEADAEELEEETDEADE